MAGQSIYLNVYSMVGSLLLFDFFLEGGERGALAFLVLNL